VEYVKNPAFNFPLENENVFSAANSSGVFKNGKFFT